MSQRIRTYVTVIVGASVASAVTVRAFAGFGERAALVAATFFALLVMLSHLLKYEGGSRSGAGGTAAFLPVLAVVAISPFAVTPLAVGAAVLVAELAARRPGIRVVFNVGQMVLASSAAILVARLFPPLIVQDAGPTPEALLGLACYALVFHAINSATVAGAIAIDARQSFRDVWIKGAVRTVAYDVFALPVVYLLAWGYAEHGGALVLLFVIPIFGLRQLYKQTSELERSNEELLQVMVRTIEASNPYTSGHSRRVSLYATSIGRALRIGATELERLRVAALLHDVGKIYEEFAPLLRKEGDLTIDERRVMQTHPIRSAELVSAVTRLKPLIPALRSHHERWDGLGYPDRVSGADIPLFARIIAVADTVDAMTSSRPYRRALEIGTVRAELAACRGTQFDPDICDSLLKHDAWGEFALLVETSRPEPAGGVRVEIGRTSSRRRSLARVLGWS